MPVRNAASTVGAALKSLIRQNFTDWECHVVDDGSSDDTAEIVGQISRRDARIRLHRREPGGIVAALNAGIERCRAPWVARMDGDDVMHRERLSTQLALLATDPRLAGVGCHVRTIPRSTMSDGARRYERWLNSMRDAEQVARERYVECPLAHPTLVVRRELIHYRARGWPEDYDLLLRLIADGHRLGVVPRRLLLWRDSTDRLQRRDPTYALERFVACKAAFLSRDFLGGRDGYVLWGHGATGRALKRALGERGHRPTHIVELHPGRLGNRIDGAPVIAPAALFEQGAGPVVVSVAGEAARREIRARMTEAGRVEGREFVVAA